MPPRIPPLPLEDARRAASEAEMPAAFAELNIFRVLLNEPSLAKAVNDLLLALFGSKLDHRLRELVIMRIGWATACDYEWTQHWRIAPERFGVTEEELLAVRDWQRAAIFGEPERAVLAATDETLETGSISAAAWKRCETHVGGKEALLALVTSVAAWRLISQIARSLEVPLEEGVASWPPNGVAPPLPA